MRTDSGRRRRRTSVNGEAALGDLWRSLATSGDLWRPPATSGNLVDHETLVMGRDSWRYDVLRPLPLSGPLLSVSAIA